MKIHSTFTHQHIITNLYAFFLLQNTIKKNIGDQTVSVPIDLHYFCPYNERENELKIFGYLRSSNIFFYVPQKKESRARLEWHEIE